MFILKWTLLILRLSTLTIKHLENIRQSVKPLMQINTVCGRNLTNFKKFHSAMLRWPNVIWQMEVIVMYVVWLNLIGSHCLKSAVISHPSDALKGVNLHWAHTEVRGFYCHFYLLSIVYLSCEIHKTWVFKGTRNELRMLNFWRRAGFLFYTHRHFVLTR